MSKEQSLDVARRFREVLWSCDDPSVIDDIISHDCVVHGRVPFTTGFATGPEAIRQLIAFYQLTFSEIRMSVEQTVAEGDLVAVRWSARGCHTGDLLGVPASGREVETSGIDMLRIEDGQVIEGWMTWDAVGLLWQLLGPKDRKGPAGPDLVSVVERMLGVEQ